MKKFISGLIIGLMISVSISFADSYNIVPNSFPIYVNGTQQSVEALNINGTTWIRLGSISGILGASAVFDEVSKQINIDTIGGEAKVSMTEDEFKAAEEAEALADKKAAEAYEKTKPKYYMEGTLDMMDYKDKKYVNVNTAFNKLNIFPIFDEKSEVLTVYESKESYNNGDLPKIVSVPMIIVGGKYWIEYTYYNNAILPLIQ